jgi:hypothetical protein
MPRRPRKQTKPRATTRVSSRSAGPLLYKVVELSTVDEGTLERTLNEWCPRGWKLENVQFAMRESSKRPSMAFVFFTREGEPVEAETSDPSEARARLVRLSEDEPVEESAPVRSLDPWQRLRELAEGGDEPEDDSQ